MARKAKKADDIPRRRIARFGWVPDLPDSRDLTYSAPLVNLKALPPKFDLRKALPPVYDQGQLGSCTANAIGTAFQFGQQKQKLKDFVPSRLFIYYNERDMEGTIGQDSGAYIRDGIKSVHKLGVCPETKWPYDPSPFPPNPRLTLKPTQACYTEAKKHTAEQYARVPRTLNQMKGCLASGYPFVYGFTVYESFDSATVANTGVVPMPKAGEEVLGGHAVLAVGYDETTQRFIVRNSWGTGWGMKGNFTMPYSYLLDGNLSDDFWTIRLVK
ncbi:MAG: C1 family peptidase [Acidobacteriota bacterium]